MAYVYLPDRAMLNALLIESGHGYADPRFSHSRYRQFAQLQRRAQHAGVGLWAAARAQDLPDYLRQGGRENPAGM